MNVQVLRGALADSLLACETFRREWDRLRDQCPWATAFQSPGFAATWYRIYRNQYQPLLLISKDADGRLQGLLPLAVTSGTGAVVAAGAWQAEYQGWICPLELGNSFPMEAFNALRRAMPSSGLMLRYVAPNTPLAWLDDPNIKRTSLLGPLRRPLMRFGDGSAIEKSLRRSRNTNLRTLCKVGPVDVVPVDCPAEGATMLDTFIRWYDFRQAGVHGAAPFRDDPNKQAFYRAMMEVPGLLHVSSLRAGEQIASIHFGVHQRREMTLGAMAYNPLFGKQSPGKLHVQILARALRREGYEQLDLTPGGDAYKQRHATNWETVHALSLFPTESRRHRAIFSGIAKQTCQRMLATLRVSPNQARSIAETVKHLRPIPASLGFAREGARRLASSREIRLYACNADDFREINATECPVQVRCDAFEDFLLPGRARANGSRRRFVQAALERFEHGEHSYTCTENGRLLHVGWLIEGHAEEIPIANLPGWLLPKNCALITDLFTLDKSGPRAIATRCLARMVKDAMRVPGTKAVMIALPATDAAARNAVEAMGFVYELSICEQTRLGRVRRWTRQPPTAALAPVPQQRITPRRYEAAKEIQPVRV